MDDFSDYEERLKRIGRVLASEGSLTALTDDDYNFLDTAMLGHYMERNPPFNWNEESSNVPF